MNGQESSSGYYHLMTEQVSIPEEDEADSGDVHPTRTPTQSTGSSSTTQRAEYGGPGGLSAVPKEGIVCSQSSGGNEQESSLDQLNVAVNRRTRVSFNGKACQHSPSSSLCKALSF